MGGKSILVQASPGPVVVDDWPDGDDVNCECGQVLARCIVPDQVWNISIQCSICGGLVDLPSLPPGAALPGAAVVLHEKRYVINGTVELKRQALIGQGALDQRIAEIGERGSTFRRRHGGRRNVEEGALDEILNHVVELGEPFLPKLELSDRLGQASPTPPKRRHGMARAVALLREGISSLNSSLPMLDPRAVTELDALRTFSTRWRGHPEFESLRQALESEYEHTVVLLAAATLLEDHGNGVVLQATGQRRTPDLRLVLAPGREASVEVKAPHLLSWREEPVTSDLAVRVITKALKKAGTGRKGQLSRDKDGLLVVGGFHLNRSDLDRLERAAERLLKNAKRAGTRRSLLGISIVNLGSTVERSFSATGEPAWKIGSEFAMRIVRHPGFKGDLVLQIQSPTRTTNP